MINTRHSRQNHQGFSIAELMVAIAILGAGVWVSIHMRKQNFQNVIKLKDRQESSRIGHYLLTFTDCQKTMADPNFSTACAAKSHIRLLAADNTEILPQNGQVFENINATAICDDGLITIQGTLNGSTSPAFPLLDGVPIVCKNSVVPCTINPAYNPFQIDCAKSVKSATVWSQTTGWSGLVKKFSDTQAKFISPLKPVGNKCPMVPGVDKLIYTTYVDIKNPGAFEVESIIDDVGSVRFWEDGDPSKEIVVAGNAGSFTTINLKEKKYVIVVDATDKGQTATGAAFSVREKSSKKVVRRSEKNTSNDICIFRVGATENVSTYVPKAASCRQCYGNLQPPSP